MELEITPEVKQLLLAGGEVEGPVGDLLKGRLLAFVDRYSHYEIPEAGKKILRGRDVKMQLFTDVGEAEKWLLAN